MDILFILLNILVYYINVSNSIKQSATKNNTDLLDVGKGVVDGVGVASKAPQAHVYTSSFGKTDVADAQCINGMGILRHLL